MALLDLDLEDDDIGVSDLRDPNKLVERLRAKKRVRVRKGGKTIGILVSTAAWKELQARFEALEAEIEARDDEALAALLTDRATSNEPWVQGSKKIRRRRDCG